MFQTLAIVVLATLSVWDYPARWRKHEALRMQFVTAVREGDTATMAETCKKGIELLPDDPTWHFNMACALAYYKDQEPALDELEKAIDLGFRDADQIAADRDLARLKTNPRFKELVDYARDMARRPIMLGPMANCPATGVFGRPVTMGEQNFAWDFDLGCFEARLQLADEGKATGNTGDLYFNRDAGHSTLSPEEYPGLTVVKLDSEGRERGMDLNAPNMMFPYPVFGNCSRAFTQGPYWRSLPRALMTAECYKLNQLLKFYLTNQIWVFPAACDGETGKFGDVFQSVCPYFLVTEGASWSDRYYVKAALECSRSFKPEVKAEMVKRGALAPTIQMLIRSSLKTVTEEADYLSAKAHPTTLPPGGLDLERMKRKAKSLKVSEIPPVVGLKVTNPPVHNPESIPECTYATALAWAFVLRAPVERRTFYITARGAGEYEFRCVHGECEIERIGKDAAKITVLKSALSPTSRVDVAVFGRNNGTGYGAPSFVCFSAVDHSAPYSDPLLTILPDVPVQ